jgi:hypothetical protein
MNINGNSDYPATVYVSYTTPTGSDKTATLTANNATELSSVQAERTNDAKSRIDLLLDNDRYSP